RVLFRSFVGLFMGLGSSFAVLVVAEMLGVKSGIGWYLQWAQGWAAYANMYVALLIMALACSGLISALFLIVDRWAKRSDEMVALAHAATASAGLALSIDNLSHGFALDGQHLPVLER